MRKLARHCWWIIALALLWPQLVFAVQKVESMRLHRAPDHTRIVFDLSNSADYKLTVLEGPHRVVLDLDDVELLYDVRKLALANTPIKGIRVGHHDGNRVRLVFDLHAKVTPRTNILSPVAPHGWRMALDLFDEEGASSTGSAAPQATQQYQPPRTQKPKKGPRDVVVAIDPGHGGEDPGALGPTGLREKDVVMKISRYLYDLLDKEQGIKPVLIRDGDYYVPLAERRRIAAEEHNADVFLSIHADAFTDARAHGASVFRLSQNGASSATAQYLAKIENSSDKIAGVYEEEKDSGMLSIIADLQMRGSLTHSAILGKNLLQELAEFTSLHGGRRTVEEANFAVLREPKMVSLLVETGFISNREEERKLRSASHQKRLALALRNGVTRYFEENPAPDTVFDARRRTKSNTIVTHHIESGDTLSLIASRYQTSITRIRELNQLDTDHLLVGQTLRVPGM
ncbi:MAG TPA: N-acetylmuramoyl-L-alanine amidase [Alcanivoracaceae bacterium]|nr:N-acetylmuramoyl-L-alanine amidase [Alcanivoracaceae bacterium]